jgi:hypothetical protein
MLELFKVNVNPHHRKTGDCSTRALCSLLGCKWEDALRLQCEESIKTGYDVTSRRVMEAILAKAGWYKRPQPRKGDGTRYKVREMDNVVHPALLAKGIIVNVACHYVFIRGGTYWDTWDSGDYAVGNYFEWAQDTHAFDALPRRDLKKDKVMEIKMRKRVL